MNHLRVRQGGSVLRFHTWPCIRQQSVAAHTWGVLAIIYYLDPEPSADLVKRAVFHDMAEYDTGDVPSSAKWEHPGLKMILDDIEYKINKQYMLPGHDTPLDPYELDVLKMADLLDMLWYCYEEYMLGNRGLKTVYVRVLNAIAKRTWCSGPYRTQADLMLAELEGLWLATSESEPS